MARTSQISLESYARRRGALSGTTSVRHRFPFLQAFDEIEQEHAEAPAGLVSFAHYDYLGLRRDPRVLAAAKAAIDTFGVGVGASRLVGGSRSTHDALERELASLVGAEDAMVMVSGYGANVTLIGHLLMSSDLILYDAAAHNSVVAGTEQSRAHAVAFNHNDLDHLAQLLREQRGYYCRALVVVEGLYSMDGDVPDLPRLLELCRSYDAWLMVDEAHSIGVLGGGGGGLAQRYGTAAGDIDLIVGTLSKSFLTCGGFVAGKAAVIHWLRATLPGFVYSVGLPPPSVAAARTVIEILRAEPWRLSRLADNGRYFRQRALHHGLDTGAAIGTAVVPMLFPDTATTLEAANTALAAGYFVPPIVQIGVPRGLPRLRFFVTAAHERAEIDGVIASLAPLASGRAGHAVAAGMAAVGSA